MKAMDTAAARFKPIDHPSDIGLIAYGSTTKELFENAAFGLFSLMADLGKVAAKQKVQIKVEGQDSEDLLINWLNELIFNEDAHKMLFREFRIKKLTKTSLEAEVLGEKIDPDVHDLYRPIKAATYNQLQLGPDQVRVIFDV